MSYQCFLMPFVVFVSFAFINTTAIIYGSTMAIPFRTILIVLILFVVVCIPLHAIGTLLGRKAAAGLSFPCRVHHLKRPIPSKHKLFTPVMVLISGVVPFG